MGPLSELREAAPETDPGAQLLVVEDDLLLRETLAGIPVLLVSSAGDLSDQAALLGAAGCLEKPIDVTHLMREVRRFAEPRGPTTP